jgi:hypothetical protein
VGGGGHLQQVPGAAWRVSGGAVCHGVDEQLPPHAAAAPHDVCDGCSKVAARAVAGKDDAACAGGIACNCAGNCKAVVEGCGEHVVGGTAVVDAAHAHASRASCRGGRGEGGGGVNERNLKWVLQKGRAKHGASPPPLTQSSAGGIMRVHIAHNPPPPVEEHDDGQGGGGGGGCSVPAHADAADDGAAAAQGAAAAAPVARERPRNLGQPPHGRARAFHV